MKSFTKRVAAAICPESWLLPLRRRLAWQWFHGNYASWAEGRAASAGYEDAAVLARVIDATRKVRDGRASWERDGWTFDAPETNEPLISVLKAIAIESGGILDVVDFGGSLGSTWWQHRGVLADFAKIRWRVVEQPHYVVAGQEFAGDVLSFHSSLSEVQRTSACSTILLSGVLAYLEKPYELLNEINESGFSHVLVDRTGFLINGEDRLVVQHTPPELGGGSYPIWLFNRANVISALGANFRINREWSGTDVIDPRVNYRGIYFQRITPSHRA